MLRSAGGECRDHDTLKFMKLPYALDAEVVATEQDVLLDKCRLCARTVFAENDGGRQ